MNKLTLQLNYRLIHSLRREKRESRIVNIEAGFTIICISSSCMFDDPVEGE
jgi:hypothetical protein